VLSCGPESSALGHVNLVNFYEYRDEPSCILKAENILTTCMTVIQGTLFTMFMSFLIFILFVGLTIANTVYFWENIFK
jgi:hypothetical protein